MVGYMNPERVTKNSYELRNFWIVIRDAISPSMIEMTMNTDIPANVPFEETSWQFVFSSNFPRFLLG
jgi:hypothetical protein